MGLAAATDRRKGGESRMGIGPFYRNAQKGHDDWSARERISCSYVDTEMEIYYQSGRHLAPAWESNDI